MSHYMNKFFPPWVKERAGTSELKYQQDLRSVLTDSSNVERVDL
jgi:hypothetical protein